MINRRFLLSWPVFLGLGASIAAEAESMSPLGMAHQNTAFGLDLYGRLRTKPGNLFLSPFSISSALAMVYAGARGKTATEMEHVLHFPAGTTQIHEAMGALVRGLNSGAKKNTYELAVANALWGQRGAGFLPEFLSLLKSHYEAGLTELDFRHHTEPARAEINQWVANRTYDKIKDLIPSRGIDARTELVLTNAIYFKGKWTIPFETSATRPADFFVTPERKVSVPLMYQHGRLGFVDGGSFQGVELPYTGGNLSMVVLVPKRNDGLQELEASLTAPKLEQWLQKLAPAQLSLFLPRFKMTREAELSRELVSLGLESAFRNADFSGMNGKRDLFLSKVFHKGFVEVNEEGTEAAAATAAVMSRAAVARPLMVRADHPFLFLIRDRKSGTILFLGRLSEPE